MPRLRKASYVSGNTKEILVNWKDYIMTIASRANQDTNFDFNPPVTGKLFTELRSELSLQNLPDELVELYKQTNGVDEKMKGVNIGELVWPIEKVINSNKEFRHAADFKELYMSFNQLMFFSDAGNGDLFCFVALNGTFHRFDIFVWNHENDSRTWVAPNLTKFIEWWVNGKIEI
jgi:hypothetical protein